MSEDEPSPSAVDAVAVNLPAWLVGRVRQTGRWTSETPREDQDRLDAAVADLIENALDRVPRSKVDDFVPEGMKLEDFALGDDFLTETGRWRVTDIGRRTITAIKLDPIAVTSISDGGECKPVRLSFEEADKRGWFNGPPYTVAEYSFDEDSVLGCSPVKKL